LGAKLTGWTITVQQAEVEEVAPEAESDVEKEQGVTSNELEAEALPTSSEDEEAAA
jgi:hypothetical protein